jgi:hypothetical protein
LYLSLTRTSPCKMRSTQSRAGSSPTSSRPGPRRALTKRLRQSRLRTMFWSTISRRNSQPSTRMRLHRLQGSPTLPTISRRVFRLARLPRKRSSRLAPMTVCLPTCPTRPELGLVFGSLRPPPSHPQSHHGWDR